MSSARRVWTFFYGSFINTEVLRKEAGFVPDRLNVARLYGFDIRIRPLANLIPAESRSVFGVLTTPSHEELARLYRYAQNTLGSVYLPEAVLAQASDGRWQPALCYIALEMQEAAAAPEYVDRIVGPARRLGFPRWYVERLESFRP